MGVRQEIIRTHSAECKRQAGSFWATRYLHSGEIVDPRGYIVTKGLSTCPVNDRYLRAQEGGYTCLGQEGGAAPAVPQTTRDLPFFPFILLPLLFLFILHKYHTTSSNVPRTLVS